MLDTLRNLRYGKRLLAGLLFNPHPGMQRNMSTERDGVIQGFDMAVKADDIRRILYQEGLGITGPNNPSSDIAPLTPEESAAINSYLASDRVPFFAPGYSETKERLALEAAVEPKLRAAFVEGTILPDRYGTRFDERIVEYPWVFTRLPDRGVILDAGSTFNKAQFLQAPFLRDRKIIIYTLETDRIELNFDVSYLFGDLREIILKDAGIDTIACISTLEHVGFTYEYSRYSQKNPWPDASPDSYLETITEFRRILRPGGRLLLTVPFGRYENHAWLQQFDASLIDQLKRRFNGATLSEQYYRYAGDAWQVATPDECSELSYFNIHETGHFEEDGLAAARAVCCIELEKPINGAE